MMERRCFSLVVLSLLVFALAGTSYGFQGRMGGMGDPYGLISDESDFLIHPAGIATGEGVKFYGNYCFIYTGVMEWDYNLDQFTPAGVLSTFYHYDGSGQEYKHNALVGVAFPLGQGRMGAFFTYDGMRGNYDGNEDNQVIINIADSDLTKDLDDFAVRLLYGLPVMGMDVGLELGMAYRDERHETWLSASSMVTQNNMMSWASPNVSLLPLMIPYDSQYWELLWKVGMGKQFDSMGIDVSLRGGYIVSSNNRYEHLFQQPVGANNVNVGMEGDVSGWRIGTDIWMRYPGNGGLTFPVLFSIDYTAKERGGEGIGTGIVDLGDLYDYTHKERSLDLKAGGGVEKKLGSTSLIAAGLYYNYLQGSDNICFLIDGSLVDNSEFPSRQEHRAIVRLVGEKEFSPLVTLRLGLDFFYGWVREDFKFTYLNPPLDIDDISMNGSHWGIGASIGGTVKFHRLTLEPFIAAGWQQYRLSGDGDRKNTAGTVTALWDMDKSRSEWNIGGGFSLLFDDL